MQFVSRDAWGARPPKNRTPLDKAAQRGTALHYSAADADEQAQHANCAGRVRAIQSFHMDSRNWADIAYSLLTCKHGFVFEGRGRGIRTAAQGTNDGNDAYHAVCFLGDDSLGRDDVTDLGRAAIADAIHWCNAWAGVDGVRPHSSFHATGCPGDDLRAWIAAGMPVTPTGQEDDMTPEQEAKLDAVNASLAKVLAALTIAGSTGPDDSVEKLYGRAKGADMKAADALTQLAQVAAQVKDLKAVVDGLALGRLEGDLDVSGLLHVTAALPPPPADEVINLP